MTPTQRFVDALAARECNPQRNGDGWTAKCPAHDDRRPSLSIAEGDDGRALVHCHAGCAVEAVCAAVGLQMKDLMVPVIDPPKRKKLNAKGKPCSKTTFPTAKAAVAALEAGHGPRSDIWTYHDLDGHPVGLVCRWNLGDGRKDIRPVSRVSEGWVIGGMSEPRPLYRLPDLGSADRVHVCEGEKAADAARVIGLTATTSAHGAKAASKTDWTALSGKEIVILPDNDLSGQEYAKEVGAISAKLVPDPKVKLVELPGLPKHGDIVEFVAMRRAEGKTDSEIRAEIETLADSAPVYSTPPLVAPVLVRVSDVKPQCVRWMWPGRIALGKLTLIAGDPGLGKSFLTLDIAARVTRGLPWPDDGASAPPRGGVVLLSAEDDIADTIRPRLDAAGADPASVQVLTAIKGTDADGEYQRGVDLTRDLGHVESAIRHTPDCRLVICDPISAYLGGADSHRNAEIRGLLTPLADLAVRQGVAVVAVTHLRKGEGPAIYRSMGSLAFVAAARAAWAVAADRDDPARRLFLPVKNNLALDLHGLAFRIAQNAGAPRIEWESAPVEISADEALGRGTNDGQGSALDEAVEWLRDALTDGPLGAKEVKDLAHRDGVSPRTLDRAKSRLKVIAGPDGFGGPWIWRLPDSPTVRQDSPECAKAETLAHSGETGAVCPDSDDWGEV